MSRIIFETKRLYGVEIKMAHKPSIQALFNDQANNGEVGFRDYNDEKIITEMMASMMEDKTFKPRTGFRLAAIDKNSREFIGYGSSRRDPEEDEYPDIGVIMSTPFKRQGYATEIAAGLTALSFSYFSDAPIVSAACNPDNAGSIGMLERNGFALTAHHEKDFFNGQEFVDSLIYQVTREEWNANPAHDTISVII